MSNVIAVSDDVVVVDLGDGAEVVQTRRPDADAHPVPPWASAIASRPAPACTATSGRSGSTRSALVALDLAGERDQPARGSRRRRRRRRPWSPAGAPRPGRARGRRRCRRSRPSPRRASPSGRTRRLPRWRARRPAASAPSRGSRATERVRRWSGTRAAMRLEARRGLRRAARARATSRRGRPRGG